MGLALAESMLAADDTCDFRNVLENNFVADHRAAKSPLVSAAS